MKRKVLLMSLLLLGFYLSDVHAQVTTLAPGEYKSVNIGNNGQGDYTNSLLLLHEAYNGVHLNPNYAIGTITALRGSTGSWNRYNVVQVNTASAYNGISGGIVSFDNNAVWKLKTCMYNGKRYLAVEIPYNASFHDHGYKFTGWTASTGESMKCVNYLVNGQPVNQDVLNNIYDFNSDVVETHEVQKLTVLGNVSIGTTNDHGYQLAVNGKVRAKEIKVEASPWPDYVFNSSYKLPDLKATEQFIKENKHLPEIPSAAEVQKDGINLGEMNAKLLKKIEELTLYLIEQSKENKEQSKEISLLKQQVEQLSKK